MQVLSWYLGNLQDFLIGHDFTIVEKQQQKHLIARSLELVSHLLPEVASQLGRAQTQFPVELPTLIVL